nr:immunoglobulin heavy chain junction region [Mus musculus]
TVQHMITLLLT